MEQKQRILVVDDDESARKTLSLIFGKKGYKTETAQTGREALEKAAKRFFNVALLDIRLPDMEGIELLGPLKEMHPDMGVIMVTGYASLESAARALNEGASAYIIKPLNIDEVLAAIREVLEKQHLVMENRRLYEDAQRELAERKRAEEALRESEASHRELADSIGDVFFAFDKDLRYTYWNKASEELTGIPARDAIGKSLYEVFPDTPQTRRAERAYRNVLRTQRPQGFINEYELAGKDFVFEISAYPSKHGLSVFVKDITERNRAELLLRALNETALAMERALTPEEIFATAAEQFRKLGFSCMVFPTDEAQTTLFTRYLSYEGRMLKAAEDLVGVKHEDFSIPIETVDMYRAVVWEKKSAFVESAEDGLRQALPKPVKRFARRIARMLKVPRAIAAPLIVEDRVIGVLSVLSDDLTEGDIPAVTAFAHQMAAAWRKAQLMQDLQNSLEELKGAQAQLLQAQKMEAVGRLAGGVAHDFNNLLTAISGYTQLLLRDLPPDDPRRPDAQEVLKAAERAASLTRQLLAFSRRQMLQPQVLDLNALVSNMEKMLGRLIGEDIDLVTILDPSPACVKADPGQLEQVVMNLAVNAREAMPRGGELTVKTENLTLSEAECAPIPQARPGTYACLSVADTGVGMDEELIQHIFEPFFTTKEGGTGLGLSVVYGIVQQHEGWIDVQSEPGRGSTFRVHLPALSVEREGEIEEAVSLEELQGSGEGILLVEDEEGVRRFAARAFSENGYVVFEATSEQEALDIFEREGGTIHLLLSDVVLPDGRGVQLADALLSRKAGLRVVLGSGYIDDRSEWSVIRGRGFRFVQKPYTLAELLRAAREALQEGGAFQSAADLTQETGARPALFGETSVPAAGLSLRPKPRPRASPKSELIEVGPKSPGPGCRRVSATDLQGLPGLVVDDNATDRLILGRMLAQCGLEVTEAEDSPTCLRELRRAKSSSRPFRVVLLDKMMPDLDGFALAERIREDPDLRELILVMVSVDGLHQERARCQELGIGTYLVKPVKQADLMDAILTEVGRAPEANKVSEQVLPPQVERRRLRILLAEDESAAQLIGKKTLEKMGHTVQVAHNGLEAIEMLEEGGFDLVLMDVEMPCMDGFQVTRSIREREGESGEHMPIIAMTAYATKQDQEKCLEAGMDGYIAKPVPLEALSAAIEAWSSPSRDPYPALRVDLNLALQVVGQDRDLLREAVGLFFEEDYPRHLKRLREGLDRQRARAVEVAAYSMNGALGSFGGRAASHLAHRLETMGRKGDLSGAQSVLEELQAEVKAFAAFFAQPEWE